MANLMALAVAREVHLRRVLGLDRPPRAGDLDGVRVYASDQTHFSVARGLDVLGFPPDALRVVAFGRPVPAAGRVAADAIAEDRAAGRTPLAISAVAGSTNTGSVDDVPGPRRGRATENASGSMSTPPTAARRSCRRATPTACRGSSSRTRSRSIRTSGSSRPTTSARSSCGAERTCSRPSIARRSTTRRTRPRTCRSTGTSTRSRARAGSAR